MQNHGLNMKGRTSTWLFGRIMTEPGWKSAFFCKFETPAVGLNSQAPNRTFMSVWHVFRLSRPCKKQNLTHLNQIEKNEFKAFSRTSFLCKNCFSVPEKRLVALSKVWEGVQHFLPIARFGVTFLIFTISCFSIFDHTFWGTNVSQG